MTDETNNAELIDQATTTPDQENATGDSALSEPEQSALPEQSAPPIAPINEPGDSAIGSNEHPADPIALLSDRVSEIEQSLIANYLTKEQVESMMADLAAKPSLTSDVPDATIEQAAKNDAPADATDAAQPQTETVVPPSSDTAATVEQSALDGASADVTAAVQNEVVSAIPPLPAGAYIILPDA